MSMKKTIISLALIGMLVSTMLGVGSILTPDTKESVPSLNYGVTDKNSLETPQFGAADKDYTTLIDEGFETGFPPTDWSNTGWLDSAYPLTPYPHNGTHWAYSSAAGDVLTTPTITFGSNTKLIFWYCAENAGFPMSLEVKVDDTVVWFDTDFVHTTYSWVNIDLSSYSGDHTISFIGKFSSFYGQLLDDILVLTETVSDSQPPQISNVDATPNPQYAGGTVTISCDVTDDYGVDSVKVNITDPLGDSINVSMIGDWYYSDAFTILGTYDYFIWAEDTSENSITSQTYSFVIEDEVMPDIEVEKLVWNGEGWSESTIVYEGDIVTFKVIIYNPFDEYEIHWSGNITDEFPCNLRYIEGSTTLILEENHPEYPGEVVDWVENTVWWQVKKTESIPPHKYLNFTYDAEAICCEEGYMDNYVTINPSELINECDPNDIIFNDGSLSVSDSASVKVICIDEPELDIEKSVKIDCNEPYHDDVVYIGLDDPHWVTFNLTVTGDGDINYLKVVDHVPEGLTYNESYQIIKGWPLPTVEGNKLTWFIGNQSGEFKFSIYFRADVDEGFCGYVCNEANVSGWFDREFKIIKSDEACVDIECPPEEYGDLYVEKLVKPNCLDDLYDEEITFEYGEHDFVTYKLTVTAASTIPDQLVFLSVRDNLPQLSGLVYNNSYVEDEYGYIIPTSEYTFEQTSMYLYWNFTNVNPGTTFVIYYCADVLDCGLYENWANITAKYYDGGPCCPIWLYANDSAIVDVQCPSGPWVDKKASLDGVTWVDDGVDCVIGDTIWFKIRVGSYDDTLYGVNVYDYYPDFLEFIEVIEDSDSDYFEEGTNWLRWFYQEVDETIEIIFTTEVIGIGSEENILSVGTNCTEGYIEDSVWVNVSEGALVEKRVSSDNSTWVQNLSISPGARVWWNISIDYSVDSDLIMYNIIVEDTLPEGVTYVDDSAYVLKSDGLSMNLNPTIDHFNSTLTWDFSDHTGYVLSNGSWLSIVFATDVSVDVSGYLENWVNVSSKQCNDTDLFGRDNAILTIIPGDLIDCSKLVRDSSQDPWVNQITAGVGDIVSFNITIKNTGYMPMYKIGVWDTLPDNLEYVDGSAVIKFNDTTADCDPELINDNVLLWDDICTCMPGDGEQPEGTYLMPDHMASIIFDVEIIDIGLAINEANISATICNQGIDVECFDTATINVTVDPLEADAGNTYYGYIGDPVDISGDASGGVEPYSYYWDLDDDGEYDDDSGADVQKTWTSVGTYTIALKVVDDRGVNDTDSTQVVISTRDPNLNCYGNLNWVNISPGATVTGTFTVKNIGDSGSELDWEIDSYPDWGIWDFSPSTGDDLTPEDGSVTITVTVTVPDEKNSEFDGVVTVVNSEDSSDSCDIIVSLATPHFRNPFSGFLQNILEHFPLLERVFQTLFPFIF